MTVTSKRLRAAVLLPRNAVGGHLPAGLPERPPLAGTAASRRTSLLTGSFRNVLLLAMLGFASEYTVRTVIPLIVLARGGEAVIVGLLAGAFALPSIVFRPIVGRLVDSWQQRTLLRAGTFLGAALPLALLLPGAAATVLVRFVQGTGWAVSSVANQALMARLAPANRRGEASGLFMMMPALAALVAPAAGVALFTATGELGPLVLAMGLGLAAFVVALLLPARPPQGGRPAAPPPGRPRMTQFVEMSALPGTLMLVTFGSVTTLFSIFAPVYALAMGAPLGILLLYYPLYGLAQAIALPFGGRLSDRLGRSRSISLGTVIATAALAIATTGGMVAFALAAVTYALASALVNPAISAMTIERAPRARIGSAMATYSIGYQIANGLSSVVWGALITVFGFPWPFVGAIVLQAVTLGLSRRLRPRQLATLMAS